MRLSMLISFLIVCSLAFSQIYITDTDISYTTSSDPYAKERCRLDVYHPADTTGLPVVVWFHGGGLTSGSRFIPEKLKNSGYVVVAADYRLLPTVLVDSCIEDAAATVAWVFRHIDKYGGDPSKVFVTGHSAGGYLTSMIGLDRRWLAHHDVNADSIAGLIPFSGQAITHYEWRRMNGGGELQPTIDSYAPLFHVRPDAPPYVIISGDRNMELFGRYEENAYLWRMLKLVGHKDVRIYEIDGYNHGDMADPAYHILKDNIARILRSR